MRYLFVLFFLSSCAASLEDRCRYRAKEKADDARYDKSASWCKVGDDGIQRCQTPTRDDFYGMCMNNPRSVGIEP